MAKTNLSRRNFLSSAPAVAAGAAAAVAPVVSQAAAAGLINADAVRASLPRLFSGSWDEILGELIQNSQRAKARHVQITTRTNDAGNRDEWIWRDDGCGLAGDLESFRKLLAIGDSGWDAETIAKQSPLGMGLHAILAHEDVHFVTLASGGQQITIDRSRWWTDTEYYTNWQQLLRPGPTQPGFTLTVSMTPNNIFDLKNVVDRVAEGYGDLFKTVTVDGDNVLPTEPRITRSTESVKLLEYQGERVELNLKREHGSILVNWYGQLVNHGVYCPRPYRGGLTLFVRNGQPLNMQSPTRKGIIYDRKWQALLNWAATQYAQIVREASQTDTLLVRNILYAWPTVRAISPWCPVHNAEDRWVHSLLPYDKLSSELIFIDPPSLHEPRRDAEDTDAWELVIPIVQERHGKPLYLLDTDLYDEKRVSPLAVEIHTTQWIKQRKKHPEFPSGVRLYRQATIKLVAADGTVKDEWPVPAGTAFPTTKASYLDGVEGVLVLGDTALADCENLEGMLMDFFEANDDDDTSTEDQETFYEDDVSRLVREVCKRKTVRKSEPVSAMIAVLGLAVPGTTLTCLRHEDQTVSGFEVTRPGQAPQIWKLTR